jgi:hypothetical protein
VEDTNRQAEAELEAALKKAAHDLQAAQEAAARLAELLGEED